ncbi:50S ribosomal protein L4 [Candidatus Woesearchaeota archaeon]|nr:MAG: 50S ribosomal protein L4 [Candidatus Woesearchaeota archaeon]
MSMAQGRAGEIPLPRQFAEQVRPDLIRRAVLAAQANARQKYGAYDQAGKRHTTDLSKRRRHYRGSYGFGISRTPRKILSRSGTRFGWVGALAPNTVGGRRAHPPKPEKEWGQKVNVAERRKAIRSALAATVEKDVVEARGHRVPKGFPFGVEDRFEQVKTTKEAIAVLKNLGFGGDLERCVRKTRAGKGKLRGRRYAVAKSVLIVVSGPCPLVKAARNIPGVDVCAVHELNAQVLAPGAHPGRLTLFTKKALERLEKEGLFQGTASSLKARLLKALTGGATTRAGDDPGQQESRSRDAKPKRSVKKQGGTAKKLTREQGEVAGA